MGFRLSVEKLYYPSLWVTVLTLNNFVLKVELLICKPFDYDAFFLIYRLPLRTQLLPITAIAPNCCPENKRTYY